VFLHFAQQKGFDPLQTENWYHIKSSEFLHELEVNVFPSFNAISSLPQTPTTKKSGSKGDHEFARWDEECFEVGLS